MPDVLGGTFQMCVALVEVGVVDIPAVEFEYFFLRGRWLQRNPARSHDWRLI